MAEVQGPGLQRSSVVYYEGRKRQLLSFATSLSLPTVVVSRLTSCKMRDFSVLYSKDLTILKVKVAEVFGLERLVRMSEIPSSPDMISTPRSVRLSICVGIGYQPLSPTYLFFGAIGTTKRTGTLIPQSKSDPCSPCDRKPKLCQSPTSGGCFRRFAGPLEIDYIML